MPTYIQVHFTKKPKVKKLEKNSVLNGLNIFCNMFFAIEDINQEMTACLLN